MAFSEKAREFEIFRQTNPGVSFAEFSHRESAERIKRGEMHATLGRRLKKSPDDWWQAGAKAFERFVRLTRATAASKVADYGCGSLRIGGHFIRMLQPRMYFGLDIMQDFLSSGRELIGGQLLAEKQPELRVISPEAVADGKAFGATIVISTAVCYHVHPEEIARYFEDLTRLASAPGTTLVFDAQIAEKPLRLKCVSWPLEFYRESLRELDFVKYHKLVDRTEDGESFSIGTLEFRRLSS